MPKILINDTWYESIDPGTYYETEFENIMAAKAQHVFPGFHAVPFKKTVQSDFGTARADYSLIETNYREWWVVEVEMSHHSLQGHIIPQITTLANARYGKEESDYLHQKAPLLDVERLASMMKGTSPRVLVVLDRPKPLWIAEIEKTGARLAVFEIFKSHLDRFVYRINGYFPTPDRETLSVCYLDPSIPMLLKIESPAVLELQHNETTEILFDGRLTTWSRLDSADSVWLKPESRNPLQIKTRYRLTKTETNRLCLEEMK